MKTVVFKRNQAAAELSGGVWGGAVRIRERGHGGPEQGAGADCGAEGTRPAEAKYAAEVTATILTRLEDYFGIPYPYEKADQVAIPNTAGFGAMENRGDGDL